MADKYIHWDQREERRQWARRLLAKYGAGFVRDEGSGFYRPAVLPRVQPGGPEKIVVIPPRERNRGSPVRRKPVDERQLTLF